jgi:uncharacterized protein
MKRLIVKKRNGEVIAKNVDIADSFSSRAIGLMFSKDIGDREGLMIDPTNSIHTFFMNYPLDIIFLSRTNNVVKIIKDLKPWRLTRPYFSAVKVLEMKGGTLNKNLKQGDELSIDYV